MFSNWINKTIPPKLTFIVIHQEYCSLPSDNLEFENQTDEEVFACFQQGSQEAFGVLYHRYGLLVYRLLYRMLNNSQEAEDLTQEIFLSLHQSPKYNPQRGTFYTYLIVLARSRSIDKIRSKRSKQRFWQKNKQIPDLLAESSLINPMENISFDERAKQVRQALEDLSPNQRQVLELSYYQGLTQSEIAKQLNLPLGTVKTHSRRGLLKLRKNLQNIIR